LVGWKPCWLKPLLENRIGKGASKAEKRSSLQYAQDYLIAYKKPLATPISRILEGGENEVFESSFDS